MHRLHKFIELSNDIHSKVLKKAIDQTLRERGFKSQAHYLATKHLYHSLGPDKKLTDPNAALKWFAAAYPKLHGYTTPPVFFKPKRLINKLKAEETHGMYIPETHEIEIHGVARKNFFDVIHTLGHEIHHSAKGKRYGPNEFKRRYNFGKTIGHGKGYNRKGKFVVDFIETPYLHKPFEHGANRMGAQTQQRALVNYLSYEDMHKQGLAEKLEKARIEMLKKRKM